MKKLFLLIIIVLLITACIVPTAFASSDEYIEIKTENVVFYNRTYNPQPIFNVPKNCFVKYENVAGDYVEVEYHGIKGLISVNDLDLNAKRSDLNATYHTANYAHAKTPLSLYSIPRGGTFVKNISTTVDLFPIGTYTIDNYTYVYVTCTIENESYEGAVLKDSLDWDGVMTAPTNNTSTPTNPSTPPAATPDTEGTGSENPDLTPEAKDPENNLVRILLIIGICVPALIIVYLIFKPVKPSSNRYASDNPRRKEDFEDFE